MVKGCFRNKEQFLRYKKRLKDFSDTEPKSYPCLAVLTECLDGVWWFKWQFVYPSQAEALIRADKAKKGIEEAHRHMNADLVFPKL